MIFQILITVIALLLIFVFSINKFSRQVEMVAGDKLKVALRRVTMNPVLGTVTGTVVTSIIQSSTATTVMTVGLVNAGVMTFYQSLSIIFGANIGSTVTSQLIALNITAIAPLIVIAGFLLLKFGGSYQVYGKSVFYFGLVFFCMSLITQVVMPLSNDPTMLALIAKIDSMPLAILAGFILTTIFQSSAATGGVTFALAASGLIGLEQGVGLMLGANIGTTSTAILASIPMDIEAKKAALAHFVFNIAGVILFYPFLGSFISFVADLGGGKIQQIANMHLIFNIISAIFFLIFIKQFCAVVERLSQLKIMHMNIKDWKPKLGL